MNEGTETRKTVLLLGAYGLAGSAIAHGLLAETDARLLLTGRDAAKLSALANQLGSSRVETRILDAFDAPALRGVCDHADLAINAVGPYAAGGADIARTVVESGTSYIDFANEQVHYRRLESLDARARERGVMLLTAAGAVPGVSTLVALHAARQLPETDELAIYWAQWRMADPGNGVGSLMSGILDIGFLPRTLKNGRETPIALGSDFVTQTLPEPFGDSKFLGLPTVDSIVLPRRFPNLHTIQTYWAIASVPKAFFRVVRWLQPHRRSWAYRLLRALTAWNNGREYRHAVAQGRGPEGMLYVMARGKGAEWRGAIAFPDGGMATAYLPVLAAKRFLEGGIARTGLVTAADVFDPASALEGLDQRGCALHEARSAGAKIGQV